MLSINLILSFPVKLSNLFLISLLVRKKTKPSPTNEHQIKIDRILDKIGKSGYDSLTNAEKDFLFKAGKD